MVMAPTQKSSDAVMKPSATDTPSSLRKRRSTKLPRRVMAPSRSRRAPRAVPSTMEKMSTSTFSPERAPSMPDVESAKRNGRHDGLFDFFRDALPAEKPDEAAEEDGYGVDKYAQHGRVPSFRGEIQQ